MANRGLSDIEIGVIKAMLLKGMPAQDICGYMFRPNRSLNPAGVYEIRAGKRGAEVPPMTPDELESWLKNHPYFGTIADADQISELRKELRGLLRPTRSENQVLVDPTETARLEFKEAFHHLSFPDYARSLIGYSNHCGGFIIFGINNDRRIVGLKGQSFKNLDQKNVSELLKDLVSPSVRWTSFSMTILEMEIGVLYAEEAELKPLVTMKNHDKLKGSTIYFRYEGETAAIRAGDLHAIIREREQMAVQSAISKLQQITGIGLENSAIVDISSNELHTDSASHGSAQVAAQESLGAPRVVVKKAGISDMDILLDFINAVETLDPIAYLRQAAHEPVRWLPLFFYARMTGLSDEAIIDELKRSPVSKPGTVRHMRQRLSSEISAFKSYIGGAPQTFLTQLQQGIIPEIRDRASARHFSMALSGIRSEAAPSEHVMRTALRRMVELYTRYSQDAAIGSNMRRSAARVDELLHGHSQPPMGATGEE